MDRRLFDILWEVYRDVDGKKPINIISSYRSPATNSMLRRRSSGVARNSQHVLGHAIDFFIPEVPLEQVRAAGLRLQRGGVGFYPTSGSPFVHLDTGSVRHWPRMNHDQLARVFPDGRTVHVPSDGKPLKGYELALADLEKRGPGDDGISSKSKPGLFAALFGSKSNDEDDEGASAPPRRPRQDLSGQRDGRSRSRQSPPTRCRCRAQNLPVRPSSWPRPTPRSCRRPNRSRPQRLTRRAKTSETANAGRHHQCPRLLGCRAEAGHAGADRRHQRPQRRQFSRSAIDRQRLRSLQQGAGLRAGRLLAGRPRQYRRRQRADPPQRPPGPQPDGRPDDRYRGRQGAAGSGRAWLRPRRELPLPRATMSGCA